VPLLSSPLGFRPGQCDLGRAELSDRPVSDEHWKLTLGIADKAMWFVFGMLCQAVRSSLC
jgi:hypothetical protein